MARSGVLPSSTVSTPASSAVWKRHRHHVLGSGPRLNLHVLAACLQPGRHQYCLARLVERGRRRVSYLRKIIDFCFLPIMLNSRVLANSMCVCACQEYLWKLDNNMERTGTVLRSTIQCKMKCGNEPIGSYTNGNAEEEYMRSTLGAIN